MEVPAPAAGVLREILLARRLPMRCPARCSAGSSEGAEVAVPGEPASRPQAEPPARRPRRAETRRLAFAVGQARWLQHDLDPAAIEGTGRGGRITRADVDARGRSGDAARSRPRRAAPATSARTSCRTTGCGSPSPRTCSPRSPEAPHVTAVFEADFSAIIAHRAAHKAAFAKKGVKLTYTAYLVAAAAEAMKVAPAINSRWHDDRLELLRRHQYRRRHRARREGPDRAGAPQGAAPVAEGHRRRPRRADREGARARS